MKTLNVQEVLTIHSQLTELFSQSDDPIDPPGVRSMDLLESAVARQDTGFNGSLKYSDSSFNAATLMYGICMNHSFHNGNKRTAFVSGIIHLDRNKRLLVDVKENDFYELMIGLAGHRLLYLADDLSKEILRKNFKGKTQLTADEEVHFLGLWLKKITKSLQEKTREVRLNALCECLKFHGCTISESNGDTIIERSVRRRLRCFAKLPNTKKYKIFSVNPRFKVSPTIQDDLREELELDQQHGYDDDIFFGLKSEVDFVLNEYRKLLGRLAKT